MISAKVVDRTSPTDIDSGMLVISRTTGNIYLTLDGVEIDENGEPEIKVALIKSDKTPERCGKYLGYVSSGELIPFKGEITLIQD